MPINSAGCNQPKILDGLCCMQCLPAQQRKALPKGYLVRLRAAGAAAGAAAAPLLDCPAPPGGMMGSLLGPASPPILHMKNQVSFLPAPQPQPTQPVYSRAPANAALHFKIMCLSHQSPLATHPLTPPQTTHQMHGALAVRSRVFQPPPTLPTCTQPCQMMPALQPPLLPLPYSPP